ncbi:hypothetical protein RUM43_014921 [Polyplax serrata]|uniref:Replication protein A C-terminal domain-containing protein n=1 Tax=Polyplax serrata TaxID=468196 RepID=A0AAN8S2I6_POLSC
MDPWVANGDGGGFFGANEVESSTVTAPRQQFMCPVTVRQVLDAPEKGLKVGPLTATMVSLCGIVSDIEGTSLTIKFCLSDDTGIIDCVEWIETNDRTVVRHATDLEQNKYYHIYGCIKFTQGEKKIMVFHLEKVRSLNEVTVFMLEVLSASEYALRSSEKEYKHQAAANAFDQSSFSNSAFNSGIQSTKDKMTLIQRTILDAITGVQNPVGWSRFDTKITKKYSEKEILNTLEQLVSEGHIYTTIDDDHYSST